jgi:phosphoribosylformylglycinamidine synthase
VLDPEAQAIGKALGQMGFAGVRGVRKTKVIELELEAADRAAAESEVRAMCERLLANPGDRDVPDRGGPLSVAGSRTSSAGRRSSPRCSATSASFA